MPRLAANLTLLFNELPFPERFKAAADAGFRAVEFLFPYEWPAEDVKRWLEEAKLELALFNAPPGNWAAGDRGLGCDPSKISEFQALIDQSLDYASVLEPKSLHVMAGLQPGSISRDEAVACFKENMAWTAKRMESLKVQPLIEPLNLDDNPGYLLSDFDEALTMIQSVEDLAGKGFRFQFDIYHCAKTHGDVMQCLNKVGDKIGHLQIANPNGRNEPDTQSLPLNEIFTAIERLDTELFVGCEYFPKTDTLSGLSWVNQAKYARF